MRKDRHAGLARGAYARGMMTVPLLLALAAMAEATPPKPACTAPEHRQFDFWIGEWDVDNKAGKPAGRQRIVAIQGGCAIAEHWTGARGNTGTSLSSYDAATKTWKQFWTDSDGLVLALEGGWDGKAMVMRGQLPNAQGGIDLQRVAWTPAPDGTLTQVWESSSDGGKTWTLAFHGQYRRG